MVGRGFSPQTYYEQLKTDNSQSSAALAKVIGVSEGAVKQQLAKLKKEGTLQRIGSTEAGYWKVVK